MTLINYIENLHEELENVSQISASSDILTFIAKCWDVAAPIIEDDEDLLQDVITTWYEKNRALEHWSKGTLVNFIKSVKRKTSVICDDDLEHVVYNINFDNIDLKESLESAISQLTKREKTVVRYRYWSNLSYGETSKIMNITRERVRQIELKALRKLRNPNRLELFHDSRRFPLRSINRPTITNEPSDENNTWVFKLDKDSLGHSRYAVMIDGKQYVRYYGEDILLYSAPVINGGYRVPNWNNSAKNNYSFIHNGSILYKDLYTAYLQHDADTITGIKYIHSKYEYYAIGYVILVDNFILYRDMTCHESIPDSMPSMYAYYDTNRVMQVVEELCNKIDPSRIIDIAACVFIAGKAYIMDNHVINKYALNLQLDEEDNNDCY